MASIDEVIADVRALNERLASGLLFLPSYEGYNGSDKFFENLEHFGLIGKGVVVLSLTPDGDDTVSGRIMTSDRQLYYFDFDLEDCAYSTLSPIVAQGERDEADSLQYAEYLEELAGEYLIKEAS